MFTTLVKSPHEPLSFPRIDPQEKIPYGLDFSSRLGAAEIIETHDVTPSAGITIVTDEIMEGGKIVKVILSSGLINTIQTVLFHVITDLGTELERTVSIGVVSK